MKKNAIKITLGLVGVLLICALIFTAYYLIVTAGVRLDKSKLVNLDSSVEIYDGNDVYVRELSDGKSVTDAEDMPDYVLNAFVAIEDKRFYSHDGVDVKGFIRATVNNLLSLSFKEGASTITQQLIKNTHLSGEKTFRRKLQEIKLAKELEREYSKKEILEKYVNTIYFGEGCYGITAAANKYFGVSPENLTVNQSAALAGMIKAPAVYSPKNSPEKCNERKNLVLKNMLEQGYITEEQYKTNVNSGIAVSESDLSGVSPYLKLVNKEIENFLSANPYLNSRIKVYTYFDKDIQECLENSANNDYVTDEKIIVLDKNNKVKAFFASCEDFSRPLGSTIKPLAVYAPALDMNYIDTCTLINDEKTDFDGYSPSNYNDKYYGYVSAKFALAKSLNTCAVKIFNGCGAKRCLDYVRKTDIPITEKDNALTAALGATEKGATLMQISAAYGSFVNKGDYVSPTAIRQICDENGKVLYSDVKIPVKIYGEDTAFLVNDMLKYTVTDGTAKKLSFLNFPVAAKTGTVGTQSGNTDAYCVSYNGDYVISCWMGNADNSLMDNSVTGGTIPTQTVYDVWKNMRANGYNPNDTFQTDDVVKIDIDKISYTENRKTEIADENTPERYVISEYFKKSHLPKSYSSRFSYPKIENGEISVNNNEIHIRLCLPSYCGFRIYRKTGNFKILIYDSKGAENVTEFTDKNLQNNKTYRYSVVPYVNGNNGTVFGEEYFFKEIKTSPTAELGDDWWQDLFPISD